MVICNVNLVTLMTMPQYKTIYIIIYYYYLTDMLQCVFFSQEVFIRPGDLYLENLHFWIDGHQRLAGNFGLTLPSIQSLALDPLTGYV